MRSLLLLFLLSDQVSVPGPPIARLPGITADRIASQHFSTEIVMSVNGINNSPLPNIGSLARPDGTRPSANVATSNARTTGTQANGTANANANALKPQTPIAGPSTQNAVPAEAPTGTDPELWSVLTADERNFFAKSAALGPLTYGRIKAAINPAPAATARGVRLDVRA